jgi:PIN domain nuclease of toxin-antitoxin system
VILLDTNSALWLTDDQSQLSKAADAAIVEGRRDGGVAISDITLWEVAMLAGKKRITIPRSLDTYLRHLEDTFTVLPITASIAEHSVKFSAKYPKDLADKIIGATAVIHGLRLVTADAGIRASGEVKCIW